MSKNYSQQVSIKEIVGAGIQTQDEFGSILSHGFTFVICLTGRIEVVFHENGEKNAMTIRSGETSLLLGLRKVVMVKADSETTAYTVHFDAVFLFSSIIRSLYTPKEVGKSFMRDHRCLKHLLFKTVPLPNMNDIVSITRTIKNGIESDCPTDYLGVLCEAFIMAVENTVLEDGNTADERISDISLRFLLMAVTDFDRSMSVEQYAHELNISRSKLNATVQAQTGYTASKLIDKITAERIHARQRIGICDAQIAKELRFSSLSNMKRFMKKTDSIELPWHHHDYTQKDGLP